MKDSTTDARLLSEEVHRQVGEALWWLSQDCPAGAEKLKDILNESKDRYYWWQFLAHYKLVVEEDLDNIESMGDC